ncbi:hypothetical protein J6590_016316 [Homalodisca vitripennis]|nr:hypothetical protein J6590_016316 [Homalodisca vitripennis]
MRRGSARSPPPGESYLALVMVTSSAVISSRYSCGNGERNLRFIPFPTARMVYYPLNTSPTGAPPPSPRFKRLTGAYRQLDGQLPSKLIGEINDGKSFVTRGK